MKNLILCLFLVLFAFQIHAKERHSPAYKCQTNIGNGKKISKYVLVGNKFEQSSSIDFSDEAVFVSSNEYFTGGYEDKISKIKFSNENEIQTHSVANDYNKTMESFHLYPDGELVHSISILNDSGEQSYTFRLTYNCKQQKWVD